jgi:hypothetical protein
MRFLEETGRTFRVERVPLCYMAEYPHCSTETRKIVKGESRTVYFLDEKGVVHQTEWRYGKADACRACRADSLCAGLYEMDASYPSADLYPLFTDPEDIRRKILVPDRSAGKTK